MEDKTLWLEVPVEATPKGSMQNFGKYGMRYGNKAKIDGATGTIRAMFVQKYGLDFPICTGAVAVGLVFEIPRPKGHLTTKGARSSQFREFPTVKPDNDKVERTVYDALTGLFMEDDKNVILNPTAKVYSSRHLLRIIMSPIENERDITRFMEWFTGLYKTLQKKASEMGEL